MKIQNLFCGGWASNCYYVTDDSGENAVVIDPSMSPNCLPKDAKAKIHAVLLTHTHYDHIMALNAWRKMGIPVMVSESDAIGLSDANYNVSLMFGRNETYLPADKILRCGDAVTFGSESLTMIATPGHTAGSCCFYTRGILFSGDTMFARGGIGRFDLPSGSYGMLLQSLDKILAYDPDTVVYPGHGEPTTIAVERNFH